MNKVSTDGLGLFATLLLECLEKSVKIFTVGVFGKECHDVLDDCLDLEDAVDFTALEAKFGDDLDLDGIPGMDV